MDDIGNHAQKNGEIPFTVASALLRELGERLVGKPHIALAELVKNSYDADARYVNIDFQPDTITVSDDGHGMTLKEFTDFWMQIGTPHKQKERVSREFKRPLTGSKGVGRLAVQFLARRAEIRTVVEHGETLVATVNWQKAVEKELLTEAIAQFRWDAQSPNLPEGSSHGTKIILTGLNQNWEDTSFQDLAREIWMLQPPFPDSAEGNDLEEESDPFDQLPPDLRITLSSYRQYAKELFDAQMTAVETNWIARIRGRSLPTDDPEADLQGAVIVEFTHRPLTSLLKFSDRSPARLKYYVVRTEKLETGETQIHKAKSENLGTVRYDIRIYNLNNRQPEGIKVEELRRYLKDFGGVHIYDTGFRLPFYGGDTDWLNIEKDHSHRLGNSALLPDRLQEKNGLNDLPTNQRILGLVYVDTGKERLRAIKLCAERANAEDDHGPETTGNQLTPDYLSLSVTRDRLVDNDAFSALSDFVRFGLDFYATEVARRKYAEAAKYAATVTPSLDNLRRLNQTLEDYQPDIPPAAFADIKRQIDRIERAREGETALETQRTGLLGALATAGITAIAYEHEVSKQIHRVEGIIQRLDALKSGNESVDFELAGLVIELRDYLGRTRATRSLFSNVMNEENREERLRFRARAVVQSTVQQMGILLRNTPIRLGGLDDDLRLPTGSYAEWSSVFQNVLINAVSAMLDSRNKIISVSSRLRGKIREITIQDTGSGIELSEAEELFQPFHRRQNISPEHEDLSYGGTGLGLTIVRMIASNLGCKTLFVKPDPEFSTAFRIAWEEV